MFLKTKVSIGIALLALFGACAGGMLPDLETLREIVETGKRSVVKNARVVYMYTPGRELLGIKVGIIENENVLFAQNIPCLKNNEFDLRACEDVPIETYLQKFAHNEREMILANIEEFISTCRELCPDALVEYDYKKLFFEVGQQKAEQTLLRAGDAVRLTYRRYTVLGDIS